MASDKAKVNFVIGAQDAASAVIKKVNSSVGGLKKGVGAVGTGMGKLALAGGVAVGVIAAGIGVAAKAAADEEKGIARLNAAVKANVKSRTDMAKVEKLIAKRQETLAFSDGELRDSMAALLPFTKNIGMAYKWQGVAADLARTKNIGLEEASLMVAKAMNGNEKVFGQLGITLPKTAKEIGATTGSLKGLKKGGKATAAQIAKLAKAMTPAQKKAAKIAEAAKRSARQALVLAAIQGKVAGQAKAYAKGTEGQFASLKNSFDDVVEDLGKEFLPIALEISGWVKKTLLPVIKDALPKIADFKDHFLRVAKAVADTLQPVVAGLRDFIVEKINPALEKFAGWIKDTVVPQLESFADWVGEKINPALDTLNTWVSQKLVVSLGDLVDTIKNSVIPQLSDFWDWVKKNGDIVAILVGAIAGLVAGLKLYGIALTIQTGLTTGLTTATGLLAAALAASGIGKLAMIILALVGGMTGLYLVSSDFRKAFDDIVETLKPVLDIFWRLIGIFGRLDELIDGLLRGFHTLSDEVANSPLAKIVGGWASAFGIPGILGGIGDSIFGKPVAIPATSGSGGSLAVPIPAPQVTTYVTLDGKKIAQSIDVRLGQTRRASNPQRGDD